MKNQFTVNKAIPFIIAALAIGFATSLKAEKADKKTNIVFFLTDDQGYGDLGCFGAKDLKTPNIDKLAEQGMKFKSFYVSNRCSPTRMSFMTGAYPQRAGDHGIFYRWDMKGINSNEITTPELLKKAGYATGAIGKWHLGEWAEFHPMNHGFDEFFGFMETQASRKKEMFKNREPIETLKYGWTDGRHSPRFLEAGLDFITRHKDEPFFLYFASPLPHSPWLPMDRFKGTSERGVFGDVIHELDWQVGALMDRLDELGLTENTLFVYATDNGPELRHGEYGTTGELFDGKWGNFEGGIRVPCIMRWPAKIPAGTENDQITGVIDLLPTFSAIAGVKAPTDRVIDGRNILPYMENEKLEKPIRDFTMVPGVCIRYGNWKLFVRNHNPGGPQKWWNGREGVKAGALFNLKEDIGEQKDVSAQYPEKVKELTAFMNAFMKELEANKRPVGTTADYSKEKAEALKAENDARNAAARKKATDRK